MGEIWVERKVGPCLAWGFNKALCRAVEYSSGSMGVCTTSYNAVIYCIKLLSSKSQDRRRYLNKSALVSAFWTLRHHSCSPQCNITFQPYELKDGLLECISTSS